MAYPAALLAAVALAAAPGLQTAGLRLNQLQVIGTHNSYKAAVQPELLAWMRTVTDEADAIDYAHAPLDEQLDLGVRGLEIDLYYDPDGGRYAAPRGQELLRSLGETPRPWEHAGAMGAPGFKVMHSADFDFRSNHATLDDALAALLVWSASNTAHLPVVVLVNLKSDPDPIPDATQPAEFDAAALDKLDAVIRRGLGDERLVTPDLVRGDAETLNSAVLGRGWPPLDALRGRFLWVLDEGDPKRALYAAGHPSLAGRVLFTTSAPGDAESAVLVLNDPVRDEAAIRRRVEEGYLVRTRADAGTVEARRGDSTRFEAAQRSGAQVISTDYPRPDERFRTGYAVRFADGSCCRRNPVTAAASEPGR